MVQDSNNGQADFPYEWITTKDNSLTLKPIAENSEWMHSLHGAYSESQYIYGDALKLALESQDNKKPLSVLSMGLGLGYLELITAFECVKESRPFKIYSFELDPKLKILFVENCKIALKLLKPEDTSDISFKDLYKNTFKIDSEHFKTHFLDFFFKDYGAEVVKDGLIKILSNSFPSRLKNENIELHKALTAESLNKNTHIYNLIFYDAFSSNSQSELWNEDFLNAFLNQKSDPYFCVLSTYAKVGSMTRALKSNGFQLLDKKGYAYKRESTFALKKA